MITLGEIPVNWVRAVAVTFGLLWGSFINVVIYRTPREMSVVRPASHCTACSAPIAAFDNIPLLSFLLLRGRARCCNAKLSRRYPVVELIGGALSLAILEAIVLPTASSLPMERAIALYLIHLTLSLALVAAAFIDAETMILPDPITLGGTLFAIVTATLHGTTMANAAVAASCSFLILWFPFIALYKLVRGAPGMGLGDAKLLALIGAWLGIRGAIFSLFAGAIQGTLFAVMILLIRGRIEDPAAVKREREALRLAALEGDEEALGVLAADPIGSDPSPRFARARIPFGPCLILGAFEALLCGDAIEAFLFQ